MKKATKPEVLEEINSRLARIEKVSGLKIQIRKEKKDEDGKDTIPIIRYIGCLQWLDKCIMGGVIGVEKAIALVSEEQWKSYELHCLEGLREQLIRKTAEENLQKSLRMLHKLLIKKRAITKSTVKVISPKQLELEAAERGCQNTEDSTGGQDSCSTPSDDGG